MPSPMLCTECCANSDHEILKDKDFTVHQESVIASAEVAVFRDDARLSSAFLPPPRAGPGASGSANVFVAHVVKRKAAEPIGLHLDLTASAPVVVLEINDVEGPVANYNRQAEPGARIQPGDYITAVNGQQAEAKFLASEMQKLAEVSLEVRRPLEFSVKIDKSEGVLGTKITYASLGKSLVIEDLYDGPVKEWNEKNPDRIIRRFDRIISVNGQSGSSTKLLGALGASQLAEITLSRPHGL